MQAQYAIIREIGTDTYVGLGQYNEVRVVPAVVPSALMGLVTAEIECAKLNKHNNATDKGFIGHIARNGYEIVPVTLTY